MTEARDQLRKLTECCICFKTFTDPRMLPCIHTFCLECLKQTGEAAKKKPGKNMPCPLCRIIFLIPAEGMNGLQKNFFMQHLMDVTTTLKLGQEPVIDCDMCKALHEGDEEKTKQALMRCLECGENFCDMCSKAHKLHKLSKTHNIVNIGSETEEDIRKMLPTRNCVVHYQQPLNFYCADCKKIICVSCFVENHASHKCKDVTTVEKEFRQTIETNALKISNRAEKMLSKERMVEQRKTEVLVNLADTEDKIRRRNLEVKEIIDRHTDSLLEELSLIKQKQVKEFANDKEEIYRIHTILKSFEFYCTELISKGSASDVCSCVDELTAKANELEKYHDVFIGRPFQIDQVTLKDTKLRELLRQPSDNIVGRIECEIYPFVLFDFSQKSLDDAASTNIERTPSTQHQSTRRTDPHEPECDLVPTGFQTLGNTCYFKSVTQCLLQTVLFPYELTLASNGLGNVLTDISLSGSYLGLTSKYNEYEQRNRALTTLYYKFSEATPRFNDQRQYESHDLLIHFLDKFRVEEQYVSKLPSAGSEFQKMPTAVDKIFGGQFITVYICHSCDEPYAIREPFLDISISICALTARAKKWEENKTNSTRATQRSSLTLDASRKASSTKNIIKNMLQPLTAEAAEEPKAKPFWFNILHFRSRKDPNVSQYLKYFTRAEVIEGRYLCPNCRKQGGDKVMMISATKQTLISSPPAVLVLHLDRFEEKSTGSSKHDEMILYDELLDLGPFCSFSSLRIDPEEENVWYSLYAVVVRRSFSLSRSQYSVYVKQRDSSAQLDEKLRDKFLQKNFGESKIIPNDDDLKTMETRRRTVKRKNPKRPHPISGQWYHISDNSARSCDAEEALDQKAFLLFYERIPNIDS